MDEFKSLMYADLIMSKASSRKIICFSFKKLRHSLDDLPKRRPFDTLFSNHKLNLVLRQPDLGYYPIQPNNETGEFEIVDNYLWNKCIKADVYQKGLYLYGRDRYKRRMTYYEDLIVVIIVFRYLMLINDDNKETDNSYNS